MKKNFISILLFPIVLLSCSKAAETHQVPLQTTESNTTSNSTSYTPHPTATNKAEIFSFTNIHTNVPDDILQHINYGLGGGEGGFDCPSNGEIIEFAGMMMIYTYELTDTIKIFSCGWEQNEKITTTIISPNGKKYSHTSQSFTVDLFPFHSQYFEYETTLDDPLGAYKVVVEGPSGTLETEIQITISNEPRLYVDKTGNIALINFIPNENFRLFAYDESADLVGWKEFSTNADGKLYISADKNYYYAVYGEITGELTQYNQVMSKFICNADYQSQIVPLTPFINVIINSKKPLEVWSNPETNAQILAYLEPGTIINIYTETGPECADKKIWWHVTLDNGVPGWIAEGDENQFWIEPYYGE